MLEYIKNLSGLAQFASILSFFISIYLLFGLRRIKKDFEKFISFKTRIPVLREELENSSSEIIKLMNEYPDSFREIEMEIRRTNAILKSLRNKVSRECRKTVDNLTMLVISVTKHEEKKFLFSFFRKNKIDLTQEDKIYEIHGSLVALIVEIKNLEEDQNWSIINER